MRMRRIKLLYFNLNKFFVLIFFVNGFYNDTALIGGAESAC